MQNSSPRILVVDDEPNVLLTLRAILMQEGYSVDACGGGAQALKAIRERHYDLVLTDLKMPDVDGLAVLAEVRKCSPNTVTVMLTGFGSVNSAIEAVHLGAYEYLVKPAEVPELKAAVQRALERKRLSEIDTLYRINRTLTSSPNRDAIAFEVCDAVTRVLGVSRARLLVLERSGETAEDLPPNVEEFAADMVAGDAESEDGESGHASDAALLRAVKRHGLLRRLSSSESVTSEDAGSAMLDWARKNGVCSFAMLPGIAAERLSCVLWADNGNKPYEFHASSLRFLQALASQTALVLENTSLITELKRNNRELAAANHKLREFDKLKSQFLSVATHELRTPLSVILGYNAMLAESLEDRLTPDESDTIRESVTACKRLIRLVNSMLDISQIESGKMKMNLALTDLNDIVSGVVSLLHYAAEKKNIALCTDVPEPLPQVEMDAERMQQVLINLVGNALKFTDAGGRVTISARADHATEVLQVSVSDTGIGISEEDQSRIFDEFAQIQRQTARRQREGSGLGLAIARRIVEAHNGAISVSSKLGEGSMFTFTIPTRARRSRVINAVSA